MMIGSNEQLKKEIIGYFTEKFRIKHRGIVTNVFKPLDNKYREYYTGVTLNYITYDLLKAKYKKRDVVSVLKELYDKGVIKMLTCPDIKKRVFEKAKGPYGCRSTDYGSQTHYDYLNSFLL